MLPYCPFVNAYLRKHPEDVDLVPAADRQPVRAGVMTVDRRRRLPAALSTQLLIELEPVVAANLDRHLAATKDWNPHDYVPWSRGRDFAFLGGEDWQPEESPLDPVAQTAMVVNLMTEDNLPSYHREIATRFSRDGAWGAVGRALDGRRGPARDRDPRLPGRDPRRRPGRARAARGWSTCRPATTPATRRRCRRSPTSRSRSWRPGSRTATPAARVATRWPSSCWPASASTRTCTWSSTAT